MNKDQNTHNILESPIVNSYITILYYLVHFHLLTRTALITLTDSVDSAYRAIRKGVERKHIKEHKTSTKINGRTKSTTFFRITSKGLNYLRDNYRLLPKEAWCVKELYTTEDGQKLILTETQPDKLIRFTNVSSSACLMFHAGAETKQLFLSGMDKNDDKQPSKEDEEKNNTLRGTRLRCLNEIVNEAKEKFAAQEQTLNGYFSQPPENEFQFTNVFEVKQLLAQKCGEHGNFIAGRYVGIAESPLKSVIVYVGNRAGMSWSAIATKPEFSAHHAFSAHISPYKNLRAGENHGIMLVDNVKMFADLFLDKHQKRGQKAFADGFNSFHIFPFSKVGSEQICEFMFTDIREYELALIEAAVHSGIYKKNEKGFTNLLPLVNENGTPMAIGVFMDTIKLSHILTIRERIGAKFGIICYEWQIDFYRRVVPGTVFMTIG